MFFCIACNNGLSSKSLSIVVGLGHVIYLDHKRSLPNNINYMYLIPILLRLEMYLLFTKG